MGQSGCGFSILILMKPQYLSRFSHHLKQNFLHFCCFENENGLTQPLVGFTDTKVTPTEQQMLTFVVFYRLYFIYLHLSRGRFVLSYTQGCVTYAQEIRVTQLTNPDYVIFNVLLYITVASDQTGYSHKGFKSIIRLKFWFFFNQNGHFP